MTEELDCPQVEQPDYPRCYGTDQQGDHSWTVRQISIAGSFSGFNVFCEDCALHMSRERAESLITEYYRIVQTGFSILQGELDDYRADFEAAAGDLRVDVRDAPPGSQLRRVIISNRLIGHARDGARAHAHEAWQRLSHILRMVEEGKPHVEIAAACHAALEKVAGLP